MLFNRQGLQQKNWRMVKKGKHILFGCSLFFVVGGVSVNGPQVTYASEINSSELSVKQDNISNKNTAVSTSELNNEKQTKSLNNTTLEKNTLSESKEEIIPEKEANKEELKNLVDKIKKADISGKTEKSVKELNLVLSRAEKVLENKEITQEEIDKEVKALNEVFEKLEDKPREDKKSEVKEKVESKKDEKVNSEKDTKEKQQVNNTEDVARRHNEKITKATNIVKEINSLASEINYEFSDSEKELVNTIEKLPTTDNNSEESIQKLLNEAIYLRNRVANRVTRANSGRRDPRNGKVIDKNGESGFRGVVYNHKENRRNGNLIENGSTAVYYNSDEIWSLIEIKGERVGNERKFTTFVRGKVVEDVTPYYIVTVGFTGNSPIKGLKMHVAYWDKKAGVQRSREIEYGRTEINNPITNAAIRGVVGEGAIVQPGRYEVHIASNTRVAPNQLKPYTFTFIIKPQSERNTVKDLSQTYVDDVRHLTENEKTALIEKFKTEHPDVMKPSGHKSDFDHAEVSADGATMTIHFKDGFNPKTIQTNATNDVEAKHSSLTAYFDDNKELYTNPRQLVRSKTGNEVPSTAQVTYKTPFNLQQVGTRNVVVTTTYENGVTKDITTPYTVLDFIGKQDKKINQNQSGQLGDARNYITVSDNSALPSEFTVRWKGGSSTVDTSAAGVQYKEIEILRGNHLMKTVRIPVEIVDNINPTITAPDSVLLTRLEGLPSEINISAQDNNKGVGLKDGNPITVENLPNPLFYNPKTSKIEINGVIPNNFQNGKSSIQVTVKAVDRKGNTATKNITFNIQSQTQKYTAVANPKIQEVSHAQTPDPGTSISTTGLPANTQYKWERKPDTNTPGNKDGVVKVTYPDGSTDIVNVTVKVRKLSDEHEPTGTKIVKNQNDSVSNNDLKAAVTINNNGNSKVRSVTSLGNISTTNARTQTINATVTYLDGTTDPVTIPLEVKDITAPTIQTPTDRQNWDLIALDRTLPSIKLTSEDNTGGTGIKSTTVTGLPDFLVYDNATKTIKFKNGVQEVTKLPDGQDSKTYNVNIQVTDNSNNSSRRQVTITVKSMTTKYSATANPQKQTVSYGQTPNAETSINKNGLPTGTTYTWRTIPNTTTGPGQKAGVVIVTYPDGSTDLVDVTVDVRKLSDEYEPTGTKIVKNQNATVTNDDLKAAVTISNNGNSKVKSVTPVGNISTTNAGTQTINATVTYLDGTTDSVTIPLEVKDVIAPTIQTPTEGQLWEITSLDKTLPPIRVETSDNSGGSGVKSIVPINLPSFLKFDKATNSIVFQDGVREVPKLSGINRTTKTVTLRVEDNAGNSSERTFQIRQISMAEKYNPQANETIQEVSHGEMPNPKISVNTAGLPAGVQYTWKSTPDTSKPGDKTGIVTVTYPDDSIDEVAVTVKVRKLSDEYEPTGDKIVKNQNESVSNDELKAAVTISNNGASKVKSVTPVNEISTTEFGDKTINATVTYLDDTTDTVTIPLEVKDVTPPTIQAPIENTNWEMTALDKTLPNMEVRAEDNANGSGIKSISVTGLPDYLEYDSATNSIKFKAGKQEVEKLSENTPSKEFNLNIRVEDIAGNVSERTAKIVVSSISTKTNPQPEDQTVNYGQVPNPEDSVNKQGLPDGTTVTWKTPPVVNISGSTTGEVEITYPDGSKDVVTVNVTVRKVSEEFTATGTQIEVNQNEEVTSDMLKGAVNATNAQGENGNAKIAKVESKLPINTVAYSDQTIQAKVTYIDGSEQDVMIQLKVKDVTKPTIQAPTNGQNWDLIAVEGENPNIAVTSEDNAGGSGVKSTTVTGLPDFLEYNESTKMIQFKAGITSVPKLPEGIDVEPHNVTITVVDNAGNETSTQVTITVKSMTTKYEATANSEKQTVSYGKELDAGASINKSGLPVGTTYTWETKPSTTEGPGDKAGVVTVTYPDGSKDTVNVTVSVRGLADEYEPTVTKIVKNQNDTVSSEDLKSAVTISNNGNIKVKIVTTIGTISTTEVGGKEITATVTYLDDTTDTVTIPLEVKDVTAPTIQTPTNGQNWDLIAVEGENPNIAVMSEDNAGGSGVKSTTVTGLPDFLEYNEATKTIQFKAGITSVPSLSEGTDVEPHNVTITVVDNAGNETSTQVTITVKSMTTKYNAVPNQEKQTVSYGVTPDAGTSVDKTNLPEGTSYAWKTKPDTNTPGEKDGVVEVTYKDGSKDTVNVKVNVNKLSDEYNVTATEIEVNQNTPVTNGDLKAKVTATSKEGNVSGTDKISTVVPKSSISTANYGDQNITAIVTFKDGTTKEVTIPLKVKDVTPPTIQAPTENTNWEMTALDKTLPNMEVRAEDNANGSGIKSISVTGLPDYLEYDSATNSIKFKAGKQEVEKLSENTPSKEFNLNIRVEDIAGNVSERTAKIVVSSISTKTNPQPEDQTVNYGQVPNPEDSVNKQGLPDGTTVTWKTPPVVNISGSTTGEVEITYPDGSKDVVTVNVTVRKVSEEFTATGTQIEVNQNEEVTSDMLKGAVNATNAQGENGNAKIAKVESKSPINTVAYGNQTIQAKVTYIDGSEQDVTIPLKVKDVTDPTILTPEENKNWEITALDKTLPVMKIKAEDNANGSGIATIEVRNLPEFLTFDESTGTIVFKEGVQEVPKIKSDNTMYGVTIIARDKAGNSTSMLVNITVWSMRGKYNPQPKAQTVDNGTVPNAEDSVAKTGLPEGTRVTWKETPEVNTPGSHPTVALVTYPDGTVDEVEVPITVKEQKDTFNPTAKQPGQTAKHGSDPSAEGSINTEGLPKGTTYTWVEKPDTNTTPGNKPGKVLITYPDNSTEEVPVTVEVTPQKDDYNPQPKPQTVDNGTVPNAEASVDKTGLPSGTTITWKETPVVNTPGSHPTVALVTYPDGTVDEVEVPITVKKQSDTFTPTAKQPGQTAKHGSDPSAEGSINTEGLPSGTTYKWVEKPDTNTTPGNKPGKVLITYPDNSTEEVTITVEVTPQKDDYNPQPKPQTVDNGTVPNAEASVDKTGLPSGTTITWKTTPDVSTPGSHPTVALVTYPDGTVDEVEVPITVKKQSDTFTPTAKQPGQTAKHGSDPSAEGSINTEGLPKGTTYTWVEKPDTNTTPGNKIGKVLITYPDNSTEEVTVTVEVTPQKDDYNPQPKPQIVDNGTVPNAEASVDKTGLPSGTIITWKETPVVNTPGSHPTVALVTYPDGTVDEVTVPITVKEQKDTFNPTAKQPGQTAKHGSDPSAEGSINTEGLPKGTTYTWVEKPDTNTTPGNKPGKVLITYPDNSTEEVPVTVEVTPQKDDYNPQPKPQTITNGDIPNANESIENVNELPEGTRVEWKNGIVPNTDTPGSVSAKITITYPDNSTDDVDVTITVNKQTAKGDPEVQPRLPEFNGGVNGDPEEQSTLPEFNGGVNGNPEVQPALPEFNGGVNGNPEVQPTLPEFSGGVNGDPEEQPTLPEFNGGVNGDPEEQPVLPEFNGGVNGDPEIQPALPEFNGGVNGDPEDQPALPEFNGGVNGDPEDQPTLPEFNGGVNGDPEEQPALPEFNGGVNGDPEIKPEVQKNKLIITKWIDENGNELKPTYAKYPKVLGKVNEAFEHGDIEGYEFVRTEVNKSGDVVIHIFRKRPNNGVGKVHNIEEILTPTVAKKVNLEKSSRIEKTSKRLANTGQSQNNSELAGLGLAIVGLFVAMKRRKKEEE